MYGHVLGREEEYVGKRVMEMEVPGIILRGRPMRRWLVTSGMACRRDKPLIGREGSARPGYMVCGGVS